MHKPHILANIQHCWQHSATHHHCQPVFPFQIFYLSAKNICCTLIVKFHLEVHQQKSWEHLFCMIILIPVDVSAHHIVKVVWHSYVVEIASWLKICSLEVVIDFFSEKRIWYLTYGTVNLMNVLKSYSSTYSQKIVWQWLCM